MNNDSNGDENSSSGSSMVLNLLRCQNEPISITLEIPEEEGGLDDPLVQFKSVSVQKTFVSEIPTATDIEEAICITPGVGKQPVSFLRVEFCEEIAHSHFFPSAKFSYKTKREIEISTSRSFNQRLLNYSQKFGSHNDNISFAYSILHKLQLNSQMNIAMRKVACSTLTAEMLSKKLYC